MKRSLFIILSSLLVVSPLTGCSSGANGDTTAKNTQSVKGDKFSTKLEEYLTDNVSGKDGFKFWCKNKEGSEEKLLTVRSYKVLNTEDSKFLNGKYFTVQIESSTQGGMPITKNWTLAVSQETDGTPCIANLLDPTKNQN